MTELAATLVGCAVQVTVVAAAGLVVAWLTRRRSIAVAASALLSAAAMVLVATALAPAPRPSLSIADWRSDSSKPGAAENMANDAASAAPVTETSIEAASPTGPAATLGEIVAAVRRLGAAAQRHAEETTAQPWLVGVLALGTAIGVARLLGALVYVRRLRIGSTPVTCPALLAQLEVLANALGVRRPVALHERPECGSPAVVGWRRPIVLMPADHRQWSDAQRRAALAHELAHIARNDVAWRLAASVAQAVHYFHPLVHWLVRRLALVQELAADRLAAAAVGGSANYLRAVSELALRLDDHSRLRAEPVVLPAFSSNLMRRIVMLRSMDGRRQLAWPRLCGAAAAALVAIAGVVAMADGGDKPADAPPAVIPASSTSTAFQRKAIDPSMIGRNGQGMMVVRVGELIERPAFAEAARVGVTYLQQMWPALFSGQTAPEIDLSGIEYVAGTPTMTLRPHTGDGEGEKGQFMIGCEELVIRFNHDVAWQEWITRYLPGSEAATEGGFTYIKLPAMPFLGEARMLVAARDSRTLLVLGDVDKLRTLVSSGDPKTPDDASTWAKLDGGLATALVTNLDLNYGGVVGPYADAEKTPEDAAAMNAMNAISQLLCDSLKEVGAGIDIDAATNRAEFRLRLGCKDQASAAALRLAIAAYLPIAKASFSGELVNPNETDDDVPTQPHMEAAYRQLLEEQQRFWVGLLDTIQLTTETGADGGAELYVTASTPFVSHIVMTTEVADASTGVTGDDGASRQ